MQRRGRFNPRNYSVSIIQESGWAPWPVGIGTENSAPTGIRCPDRPAGGESLYRTTLPRPRLYSILKLHTYSFQKYVSFFCNWSPIKKAHFD